MAPRRCRTNFSHASVRIYLVLIRRITFDCIFLTRRPNFRFVKERLTPVIRSEEQYLFLCHLIGPFLSRFNVDRPSPCILDLTVELFTALSQVNSANEELKYIDPICDLLYPLNFHDGENLQVI